MLLYTSVYTTHVHTYVYSIELTLSITCIHRYVHTCVILVVTSVTEAVATLVTPNESRTEHSITVTCTVRPESDADMCVVMAMADGRMTRSGTKCMTISYAFICMLTYVYAHVYICI